MGQAHFCHTKLLWPIPGLLDHQAGIVISSERPKHISGNFISRWTDFLTTDGEKPTRQLLREFLHAASDHRTQIMQHWEEGWRRLFTTLEALQEEDFAKTIYIRGEAHSVVKAILRNLLHATHHIGQMDLLTSALRK